MSFIIRLLEVSIFLIAELLNILILTCQLCVYEIISYLSLKHKPIARIKEKTLIFEKVLYFINLVELCMCL